MVNEHKFWDAERLATFVRSAKMEVLISGAQQSTSFIRSLAGPGFVVHDCLLSPPLSTVSMVSGGSVEIGVPMASSESWRVDGRRFDRGIVLSTPGAVNFMTSPGNIRFLTLQMPETDFQERWNLLIGHEPPPVGGPIALQPDEQRRMRALAEQMATFMANCRVESSEPHQPLQRQRFTLAWYSVFLDASVIAAAGALPRLPRFTGGAAHRIVTNTLDLIHRFPEVSPTLGDMCEASRTNERSLREAFTRSFGVGPQAYLRLRRLHFARRALRSAESPATSVASVATDHGFFDLGRFAGAYRQLFGEVPSATLRRTRGHEAPWVQLT